MFISFMLSVSLLVFPGLNKISLASVNLFSRFSFFL